MLFPIRLTTEIEFGIYWHYSKSIKVDKFRDQLIAIRSGPFSVWVQSLLPGNKTKISQIFVSSLPTLKASSGSWKGKCFSLTFFGFIRQLLSYSRSCMESRCSNHVRHKLLQGSRRINFLSSYMALVQTYIGVSKTSIRQ